MSRPSRDEIGPRRLAREAALQMLYALDAFEDASPRAVEQEIESYWAHLDGEPIGRDYAEQLVRGVMKVRESLDERIRTANPTWRVERMARVDRNVMRLAAYEFLEATDVPAAIAIDEAVDLAKRFSTAESAAFVNGTLDKLARLHRRL